MTPTGRRSNPAPPCRVPGGQPIPHPSSTKASCGCPTPLLPRWARCPTDHRLHLLTHAEAAATGLSGQGRALCGHPIPAAGLALSDPSAGFCTACLTQGTTR